MSPAIACYLLGAVAVDLLAANHSGARGIAWRQQQRLLRLLRDVAQGRTLYARPAQRCLQTQAKALQGDTMAALQSLPVVTKPELMQRFAEWVADPRLSLTQLQAFTADPARIAQPCLGHYTVWESSGSSGSPGMFVQDRQSMAIYDALEAVRCSPPSVARRWLNPLGLGERMAFVGAVEGHFASIVALRRLQGINPWAAHSTRCLSIMQPLDELVQALNAYAPTILSTYPTMATVLAAQRAAGHLHIAPREVWTGGETLNPGARDCNARHFQCAVRNNYGAAEFLSIASECAHGRMHANTDWVLLEPVDRHHQPVAPGQPSATTLLTHLGNRVQPLIRYDLGDQIALDSQPCACGSPLPVIQVCGRNDAPLHLRGRDGASVVIVPLALVGVLEERAGLFDFRLRQKDAQTLELAIPQTGSAARAALHKGRTALQAFFVQQGLAPIHVHTQAGATLARGAGGKACRVVSK